VGNIGDILSIDYYLYTHTGNNLFHDQGNFNFLILYDLNHISWPLFLLYSANEQFLDATNSECACPGELLTFTCTVVGTRSGATIWAGSAFDCAGNEISLRHENFFQLDGISKDCNREAIVGKSVSVVNETCFTSQLNVTVSNGLNFTTVNCSLDSQTQPVGMAKITLAGKLYARIHSCYMTLCMYIT
jgi:hypothetical protein